MNFDLVLDTIHRLPTAIHMFVLFMAIFGALIVNYMADLDQAVTLSLVPALYGAGMLGNGILLSNGFVLSYDRAANTALSACLGFVVAAILACATLSLWYRFCDRH